MPEVKEKEHTIDIERRVNLEHKLNDLEAKIDKLSADMSGLLQAWNTGKGASAFIVAVSKFMIACGILWAILRNIKWSNIL